MSLGGGLASSGDVADIDQLETGASDDPAGPRPVLLHVVKSGVAVAQAVERAQKGGYSCTAFPLL